MFLAALLLPYQSLIYNCKHPMRTNFLALELSRALANGRVQAPPTIDRNVHESTSYVPGSE